MWRSEHTLQAAAKLIADLMSLEAAWMGRSVVYSDCPERVGLVRAGTDTAWTRCIDYRAPPARDEIHRTNIT